MNKKVKKRPPTKDKNTIEDDGDKRTIVFVAIAILVIVGIVVGLLVGCQKKEEEKDPGEEIIIPTSEEKKEDVVEEYESDVSTTVVKTTVKTTEKKKYLVTFLYYDNQRSHRVEVEEGELVTPHLPKGYSSCVYFTLDGLFNFNSKINSNTEIMMDCTPVEYTIDYDVLQALEPIIYTVHDEDKPLETFIPGEGIFVGWFTELNNGVYSNKVTMLTPSIIEYADAHNVIKLYGKVINELKVTYYDDACEYLDEEIATTLGY